MKANHAILRTDQPRPAEPIGDRLVTSSAADSGAGMTVSEVARRLRVSPDKIRSWIASGELQAVNIAAALCGKPRFVILPEHLAAFVNRRAAAAPKPPPRRRRRADVIDFYPD